MAPKSDSRLCREQAARCAMAASESKTDESRNSYLDLSKKWETLAKELERIDEANPPTGIPST